MFVADVKELRTKTVNRLIFLNEIMERTKEIISFYLN